MLPQDGDRYRGRKFAMNSRMFFQYSAATKIYGPDELLSAGTAASRVVKLDDAQVFAQDCQCAWESNRRGTDLMRSG